MLLYLIRTDYVKTDLTTILVHAKFIAHDELVIIASVDFNVKQAATVLRWYQLRFAKTSIK